MRRPDAGGTPLRPVRRGAGGRDLMLVPGVAPRGRATAASPLLGRGALVVVATTLTALWAALALAWLSDWSPREEEQLQAILRAYGPGEPYSIPDFLATKVP